ncbi:hypothetical protein [uncultured Desulfovibrio sp.]|uniref:hypothetical protein n=1 Tax=uncultured Desulfovibrio sp. TaxID=167968 RepID=UPI00261D4E3C|nr:hypothetical protein [uncultured Desulfovibrio sp.]
MAPQLMGMLDIKEYVVTADTLNCPKAVTVKALGEKADYILTLKGNHQALNK